MSDYKITDLAVPSPNFDRNNPGENSVNRHGAVPILTEEQESQAARNRVAKAAAHKADQETYAAMMAAEPAKRKR